MALPTNNIFKNGFEMSVIFQVRNDLIKDKILILVYSLNFVISNYIQIPY